MEQDTRKENSVRLSDGGRFGPIMYLGVIFLSLKEAVAVSG